MNPLDILPSAELMSNSWNIYGIICIFVILFMGVYRTRDIKKSLMYRIIVVSLLTWCMHMVFFDSILIGELISLISSGKLVDVCWIVPIGKFLVDFRPLYFTFPIAILIYFFLLERRLDTSEKILNWRNKWIWVSVIYEILTLTVVSLTGMIPSFVAYPIGSMERLLQYYLGYVPTYTIFLIGAVNMFNTQRKGVAK